MPRGMTETLYNSFKFFVDSESWVILEDWRVVQYLSSAAYVPTIFGMCLLLYSNYDLFRPFNLYCAIFDREILTDLMLS